MSGYVCSVVGESLVRLRRRKEMPKFLVEREVTLYRQESWEVEAENAEEAGWTYYDGELLGTWEKVQDSSILEVKEQV